MLWMRHCVRFLHRSRIRKDCVKVSRVNPRRQVHERSQRVSPDSRRSHLPDLSLPLSQPPHHAMPYRTSECVSSKKLSVVDNVLGWLANEVVHLSKLIPRSSPSSRPLIFQFLRCRRPPVSLLPRTLLRPTHGAPSSIQLNPSTHSKSTMQKSALIRTRRALCFESATSRMVQRQQRSVGEPSEREHYSLYC